MAQRALRHAKLLGAAVLAVFVAGAGCTDGGDGGDVGGLGGQDGSDARTGGSSSGGASTDAVGGQASGGASGGSAASGGADAAGGQGGFGGLGGGSGDCGDGITTGDEQCDDQNDVALDGCSSCIMDAAFECDTTSAPSFCSEALHLGSYEAGESLPWLPNGDPVLPGQTVVYGITFVDPVWFGGELVANGAGTPELFLLDVDGDEVASFTGAWSDELLPAGDYYLRITPQGSLAVDAGYDLEILTRSPFNVGTVDETSSNATSGILDEAGEFLVIKFIAAAPVVLTGNLELTTGNVDIFLYDSQAELVDTFESTGDTEAVGPLEVPAGRYMIQLLAVDPSSEFMSLFEWDDP